MTSSSGGRAEKRLSDFDWKAHRAIEKFMRENPRARRITLTPEETLMLVDEWRRYQEVVLEAVLELARARR
jgi:hypothetical protein